MRGSRRIRVKGFYTGAGAVDEGNRAANAVALELFGYVNVDDVAASGLGSSNRLTASVAPISPVASRPKGSKHIAN
jgi:hypothetical protein